MPRHKSLANLVFVATIAASLPLGLYLHWGASGAVHARQDATFTLLAEQRARVMEEALREPFENLELLAQYFAGSEEVTTQEFLTFISRWRNENRSSEYAAWVDSRPDQKPPDLGYMNAHILALLQASPWKERAFSCTEDREGANCALIIPGHEGYPATLVHKRSISTQNRQDTCLVVATDLPQRIENAIARGERVGLPVQLYQRDKEGRLLLLHFHEPRLDAALGSPLFYPRTQSRHRKTSSIETCGLELLLEIDSSPEYERMNRERLHLLVFPGILVLALFLAFSLHYLILKLDRAEALERQAREEVRRFFALDLDLLAISDTRGVFQRVNPAWTRILGYASDELTGRGILQFIHPEDREKTSRAMAKLSQAGTITGYKARFMAKNGDTRVLEWHATCSEDSFFGAARDVSDREQDEERLRQAIANRDTLLKELHHRVKNNLQIVSSMLNLSEDDDGDNKIASIIEDAQSRIRSMALVHEALYRSNDLSGVRFEEYIDTLTSSYAYGTPGSKPVEIRSECDPLVFNLDLSIHCGILLNELLTNAVKHAFKASDEPVLAIGLHEAGGTISMTVEDNGPGLPEGFSPEKDAHLGLRLAESLGSQMGGKASSFTAGKSPALKGARFELLFQPPAGSWYRAATSPPISLL